VTEEQIDRMPLMEVESQGLRPDAVEGICREQGYDAPILCTPDELMEDSDE